MQESALDDRVRLAMAPNGKAIEKKDPLEIQIAVDSRGQISIARTPLSEAMLIAVLKKSVAEAGGQVPVIIRGDGNVKHEQIRHVMDACAGAGVWKIKLAALKEKGS